MGKAYVCDRCGELFKQNDFKDSVLVVLESDQALNVSIENTQVYISLCTTCRASFQKWWDEGAVHKTTEPQHRYISTLKDPEFKRQHEYIDIHTGTIKEDEDE